MSLEWKGKQVERRVLKAVERGVNKVMASCVKGAKSNHPGWKNITVVAEGSVRIIKFAKSSGNIVSGEWGSKGIKYVKWLEFKRGSFLRNSADRNYPKLDDEIRGSLRG